MQENRWKLVRMCEPSECPESRPYGIYQCSCGSNPRRVRKAHVETGISRSCGCLNNEVRGLSSRTHGRSKSPEYNSWCGIIQRCCNPKNPNFKEYGSRGITVSDNWKNDFTAFLLDMGERPARGYTVERINNNGPYCKDNCRWATRAEQSLNQRSNRWLDFQGEKKTLSEWAAVTGKGKWWIAYRLDKLKMPSDEVLSRAFIEKTRGRS